MSAWGEGIAGKAVWIYMRRDDPDLYSFDWFSRLNLAPGERVFIAIHCSRLKNLH